MNIKEKMEYYITQLNLWTEAYDRGEPQVTDKEWDDIYFKLEKLEQESGIVYPSSPTQKISYTVVDKLEKVTHTIPMLSLAKTKDKEEFFMYGGGQEFLISLKLDGLSLRLTYEDGKLVRAETRGNGIEGNDVTHLVPAFTNIPLTIDYKDTFEIDGECIITYKDFENIKGDYKNPRNLAAGSMSLLNPADAKGRNLRFIAWKVITSIDKSYATRLFKAEKLGFDIVPFVINIDEDIDKIIAELKTTAEEHSYPIDGLVGTYDDISFGESLGNTAHHPRHSLAYKFYDEEYETELLDIEWSIGRTGVLTPVAIFEPVDDGDSVIERASLHNVSVMRELLGTYPEYKQKIYVCKQNQIIPQVTRADYINDEPHDHVLEFIGINMKCPVCGGETTIKDNDGIKTLWCTNPYCDGKLINKIDHFVGKKGLDIKGLSKATIEKLIDWGWVGNCRELFSLSNFKTEWESKQGFGSKSVQNILDAIERAKNTNFESYLSSLGIPLIGRTVSKDLSKVFSSYYDFRKAINKGFDFSEIDGFGYEMNKSIHSYDYTEADEIAKILTFEHPQAETSATQNLPFKDKIFVITGRLQLIQNREKLINIIEKNGGKVSSSISSKTSVLINNDINSSSAKNKKAKELNIPIITEEEFLKQCVIKE